MSVTRAARSCGEEWDLGGTVEAEKKQPPLCSTVNLTTALMLVIAQQKSASN
jgi:hypothetical protein